jgi:Amt family ammonium transporter
MLSLGTMAIISVLWAVIGYSIAFGPSLPSGVIGDGTYAALAHISDNARAGTKVPEYVYCFFQMTFAIITPAVISGAVVGKIKYLWFMAFAALWHILVYCPLAHWVWAPDGWLFTWGVLDFAGGTVVETASGVSAFVLAFWLGRRRRVGILSPADLSRAHPLSAAPTPIQPHNIPYILLGAALLWFGWFGFNSGSAISSGVLASKALINTHLAAAVALGTWNLLEIIAGGEEGLMTGKATSVGAASGAIVGLVAITPGCGFVSPMWAMFIALFTTPCAYFGLKAVKNSGVDDRLDVLGFHGISGMVGTALIGLFASVEAGAPVNGAFFGGGGALLSKQLAAISVTILLCTVMTTAIFWFLEGVAIFLKTDMRIAPEHAKDVDASQHGEKAYYTALLALQRAASPNGGAPAAIHVPVDANPSSGPASPAGKKAAAMAEAAEAAEAAAAAKAAANSIFAAGAEESTVAV